ncbi:MAG: stage II sporulation protein M [bacterium]|nr:stage II sporulation protein M [bacterium]
MRIAGKQIPTGSRRMLTVFCLGFLAGIIIINIGKSILLENTGIFDEEILYRLKYMSVDGNALFCYALRKRILALLILAVLTTTYLGYVVCMGVSAWYGMSLGILLSALFAQYGIKGLILAVVSVFPQFLFYVPAVVMLLGWSENLYRAIYFRSLGTNVREKIFVLKEAGWLSVILLAVLAGCILEGYVNPGLLIGYLKIF